MRENPSTSPLVLFSACIFFAYLLPYHFRPFSAFYNDWLAVLGLPILVAHLSERKRSSICIPWIVMLPLAIAILILLQLSFGMLPTPGDAYLALGYLFACTLAIILGATISVTIEGGQRLCTALAVTLIFAALISAGIASLQFLALEEIYDPYVMEMLHGAGGAIRPVANIAQPNQLALIFCLSLASLWWLYQVHSIHRHLALVVSLLLLWGLALTQSRIGWIIIPSFSAALLLWNKNRNLVYVSRAAVAVLLGVYVFFVTMLPFIASAVGESTLTPLQHVQGHSPRTVLFEQAWAMSVSHAWGGVGWFGFGSHQLRIATEFPTTEYAQHSHNIVLNFAAELGWPATIAIFLIMIWWLIAGYRRGQLNKVTAFGFLVFSSVAIHSMVEYPLWYAYILVPLCLLIGVVHQFNFSSKELAISRLVLIVLASVMLLGMFAVAADYRRLVSGMWVAQWNSLGVEIDNNVVDKRTISKPVFTIFPHFYDYFFVEKIKPRPAMPPGQVALVERVASRFGFPDVLEKLALIYALNDRAGMAIKTLDTIEKLHAGYYPRIWRHWRRLSSKDPAQFKEVFENILNPEIR